MADSGIAVIPETDNVQFAPGITTGNHIEISTDHRLHPYPG